jgi:putative two-component system response regulator
VAAPDFLLNSTPANPRPADCVPDWDETPETVLILAGPEISRRVLRGVLRPEGYRILESARPREALGLIKSEKVDLVVLGQVTPDDSRGLEFCRAVKADRETRFVPVIILSSLQGEESEIAGISSGADQFLSLPAPPALIRARVRAMLRHKQALDALDEADALLFALAQAVEHRDSYTAGHCERLSIMSTSLGAAMGLPHAELLALHRGGFLHDIGKIAVPDAILFKPGPLSQDEWVVMRMHVVKGVEICSPARTLAPVLPIVRSHHERWDGSGYPDGLRGEEIPLLARILQVADIFDALISARPYKPALPVPEALRTLQAEVRKGWRDPALVELLSHFCTVPGENGAGPGAFPYVLPQAFEWSLENMRRALVAQNGNGAVLRQAAQESPSAASEPLAG